MKEYTTLKVSPEEEIQAIKYCETFGWSLDETREVYNESQEVVGVTQKVTSYGSFMRGFTGNDGKIEANVKTRQNVTHFLSMRFSRETTMKNYEKISALQKEFDNIKYLPYCALPKKPIGLTILGLFGCVSIILPLGAIFSWISYSINKKNAINQNKLAAAKNPELKKREEQIIAEATELVKESKAS